MHIKMVGIRNADKCYTFNIALEQICSSSVPQQISLFSLEMNLILLFLFFALTTPGCTNSWLRSEQNNWQATKDFKIVFTPIWNES